MKQQGNCLVVLFAFVILLIPSFRAYAQITAQAWLQRYGVSASGSSGSGVTAIAMDTNSNVLVTGYSWNGSNNDYATLKYSNMGTPLWTNRYDGPGNLSNVPRAIAVDHSGNVFVTGSSFLQGSPAGHPSGYRYLTVAYSGNGVPLWTNIYSVAGNDRAVAVAVDQKGNVFVAGASAESTSSSANMTTIAYSGAGVPLWTNRYKGAGAGGSSGASGMALDSNGNVFVTGYSYSENGYQHYAVVAYSGAGVPLWTNQYIGPVNISDAASAVAVDSSGNVFVTGESYNTSGFYDYVTVAYSGAGAPLWTNRYGTTNASAANAITVDSSGDVFVTGHSWSGVGFPDYATVAYTGAGVPVWTNRYDGPVHRDDGATAVAADSRGNVFVTGYSTGINSNYDYVTIGYSGVGASSLWTNRYNGPGNGNDQAAAITVDNSGNVFVAGNSWNGTNYDFATIKYSVVQSVPIFVQQLDNRLVLSWTNALFNLQTAHTLSDVFTNVSGAASPYTNTIIGAQQFFRLISN